MRWFYWASGLLILVGLLPFLSVLLSSGAAALAGCTVNESVVTPCVVLGADIGGALASMFVFGWLIFFTYPLAIAGVLLLLILLGISLGRRMRR